MIGELVACSGLISPLEGELIINHAEYVLDDPIDVTSVGVSGLDLRISRQLYGVP